MELLAIWRDKLTGGPKAGCSDSPTHLGVDRQQQQLLLRGSERMSWKYDGCSGCVQIKTEEHATDMKKSEDDGGGDKMTVAIH